MSRIVDKAVLSGKQILCILGILLCVACTEERYPVKVFKSDLRAPAYPLLSLHPDVNIWAVSDSLAGKTLSNFEHERAFPWLGAIRVDGVVYRIMGNDTLPMRALAPLSYEKKWYGRYTYVRPEKGWEQIAFNDSLWRTGEAAFGTGDQRNVHTLWPSPHIWVRREIEIDDDSIQNKKLYLRYSHDDVFQLYINGMQLVNTGFEWKNDVEILIPDSIKKTLKRGKTVIAAHCENRMGGGLVDFGIYEERKKQDFMDSLAIQKSVNVQATQTHYVFECGGAELKLTFTAPLLVNDLKLLMRPVNYVSYQIRSLDGKEHDAEIYFELNSKAAFGAKQPEISEKGELQIMKLGNPDQKLWVHSDSGFPSWGYFYFGAEKENTVYTSGDPVAIREEFAGRGGLPAVSTDEMGDFYVAILQKLNTSDRQQGKLLVGFDGLYVTQYFGDNLRPYWNRDGNRKMEEEMLRAWQEYDEVMSKTYKFDSRLMVDALLAGGKEYAELCALAYRQTVVSYQLSETPGGELLYLTKNAGPVDVYYPAVPLFLYYNPALVKAMLAPTFYYSESGKWRKPFPCHDLGEYPVISGQEFTTDLPVEEAGNMLILTTAIAQSGNDSVYVKKHWKVLSEWANFLLDNGLDTGKQLSTDLFTDPCPQNANLAIKGILGIASYGYLAEMIGNREVAQACRDSVRKRVFEWEQQARVGDHYKLSLHKDSVLWGQKYNLVWDKVLKLNAFPDSIAKKETAFYLTQMDKYGLPLDGRYKYTKTDWVSWVAALTSDRESFQAMIHPIYRFMNETQGRVPMSDLIYVDRNTHKGFAGRPVVGGLFMKMLQSKK